jgi:2-oxoisovalerate dehydrogenase E2 component (dihydrolipoyl transacylase)
VEQAYQPIQPPSAPALPVKAIPTIVQLTADRKEPIRGIKKAMVKTMTAANHIPHFSYCDEYNMNVLVEYRTHFKQLAKERGIAMSYMPFFIKVFKAFKQAI